MCIYTLYEVVCVIRRAHAHTNKQQQQQQQRRWRQQHQQLMVVMRLLGTFIWYGRSLYTRHTICHVYDIYWRAQSNSNACNHARECERDRALGRERWREKYEYEDRVEVKEREMGEQQ